MTAHPFMLCDKCERSKPPEGGVQMSSGRWYCQKCWHSLFAKLVRQ